MSDRVVSRYSNLFKNDSVIKLRGNQAYWSDYPFFIIFTFIPIIIAAFCIVYFPISVAVLISGLLLFLIFVALNRLFEFLWLTCLMIFALVQWIPAFQSLRFAMLLLIIIYCWYMLKTGRVEKNSLATGLGVIALYSILASFQSYYPSVALLKSISLLLLAGVLILLPPAIKHLYPLRSGHEEILRLYIYFVIIIVVSNTFYYFISPSSSNGYYSGTSFINGRFRGWFINPNDLATLYAVFFIPVLWYGIRKQKKHMFKLGLWLVFVLTVVELIATQSRAGILAGILSLGVLLLAVKKWGTRILVLSVLILLLVVIYGLSPTDNILRRFVYRNEISLDGNGRLEYWSAALERFWEKPIFGSGLGVSNRENENEGITFSTQGYKLQIDNSYISLLEELGVIGCLMLISMVLMPLIIRSWKTFRTANLSWDETNLVFIAIVAAGLFNAIFESWLLSVGNICGFSFWLFATFLMIRNGQAKTFNNLSRTENIV